MQPRLSVVIPTHERETRLAFALDSLAAQSASDEDFEVIVVRSPNSTGPFAEAPGGRRIEFLTGTRHGPAAKRNDGWRAARSPFVAFLDDDCRVAPDWAERMLAAIDRAGGDAMSTIVQGRTEPDPDERHLLFGLARSIEITEASGLFETCNIVYPTPLLESLDGFDESFIHVWAEDTDLGLRATAAGARLSYAGEAIAWHAVHPNPLPVAIRSAERRRDSPRLVARHPSLREALPAGLFVNVAHRDVACAAAGVLVGALAPRRRGLAFALGSLPYLTRVVADFLAAPGARSPRRVARFIAHIPVRATVDLAETAWTVRGAIESRSAIV